MVIERYKIELKYLNLNSCSLASKMSKDRYESNYAWSSPCPCLTQMKNNSIQV